MDIQTVLQYSVQYVEWIALFFSLVYIRKYVHTHAKLLPLLLLIVFCVELIAEGMANNQWIYNLSSIAELLIFSYIFYFTVKDKGLKKVIGIIFIISVLALLVDFLVIKGTIMIWWNNGFGFVGLGLSAMGIVFLIEMARSERVLNQSRILLYWVVLGLLFFNLCNLPVTVLTNDLLDIGNVDNILVIQSIAGIAMYFCFIIGFIRSQKECNY